MKQKNEQQNVIELSDLVYGFQLNYEENETKKLTTKCN